MYIPLHNHSEYSFFDGYQHPEEMARRAKEIGAEAIALTDHGTLNGIVRFVDACSEAGVRPILGNELYWTPDMHNKGKDTPTHHLVIWAATDEGYRNLLALTSLGHLEGAFGMNQHPRIDDRALEKYAKGLIASSSCLNGRIPELLLAGNMEEAERVAQYYASLFDSFVLEIQPQEIPEQYRLNALIVELAERTGLPLIVTTDSHYAVPEDAPYQDLMLAIQTRDELHDPDRFRMHGNTYWIKTEEEIRQTLLWDRGNGPEKMPASLIDEAIRGTVEVAKHCQAKLELGRNRMPAYPTDGESEQELLIRKAQEGLFERIIENGISDVEQYQDRLQRELDVIISKGYAGYFLIVSDIVQWGKIRGIPFGPSRGSAGGSLLAWALRITEIDPIRFDLIFERFLNPERESPPDIDIDVADDRRAELIEYIRSRYGSDHVAQIGTVGTMAVKDAFKRVAKAYGISFQEANRLSTRITASSLDEETDPAVREFLRLHPEIYEGAKRLQDRAISRGIHAAGVAIAPDAIVGHTALQRGKNGEIVTQADMHDIERLGLLKIDVLGLKTLSVIDHAMRLANDPDLTWEALMEINVDNPDVYRLIRSGRTESIFQIESNLMRQIIAEVKPSCFDDLVAILSLGRPGPMAMIPTYSKRKHGLESVEYLHPKLEPILRSTYGIFVYQEQAIRAATDLAGYSLGQADLLRRAIGKKKADVMADEHERFLKGCQEYSGIDLETAAKIWGQIEAFANYGFNKSHAVGYAVISVWTALVKLFAPAAFWTAVLSNEVHSNAKDRDEKVRLYVSVARKDGVEFLPPDVNRSDNVFTLDDGKIRWGLSGIKGVGEKAVQAIMEARPYKDLDDFLARVDRSLVKKNVLQSLAYSGALDGLVQGAADRGEIWNSILFWRKANKMPVKEEDWHQGTFDEDELIRYEHELLGVSVTSLTDWEKASDGSYIEISGKIKQVRKHTDRRGNEMAFVQLETKHGESVDLVVFARTYREGGVKKLLKAGKDVTVAGTKNGASLIMQEIGPQEKRLKDAGPTILVDQAPLFGPLF